MLFHIYLDELSVSIETPVRNNANFSNHDAVSAQY